MDSTMQLLSKALAVKRASRWCEQMNLDMSTISTAKKRGRLSPALAGNFAIELGENAEHWIAVAAIEAEKESPLLPRLKNSAALSRGTAEAVTFEQRLIIFILRPLADVDQVRACCYVLTLFRCYVLTLFHTQTHTHAQTHTGPDMPNTGKLCFVYGSI